MEQIAIYTTGDIFVLALFVFAYILILVENVAKLVRWVKAHK